MTKWLTLAVLLLPLAAHAGPLDAPRQPPKTGPSYPAHALADVGGADKGWGLYATVEGRSLDLRSRDLGWADEPSARLGDLEAGYGWRSGRASALIGYGQYDHGFDNVRQATGAAIYPAAARKDDSGVIGLNLVWRSR
jgi:hypothetical protein